MEEETFGVEELCREMGMSRTQINRKLQALMKQTPSELIKSFRLQRATELIRQDAGNMAEIAYQVGFNSQSYFTRAFQDTYGCTPMEYKRQMAKENLNS
jgi:AraC-like DNA-binding protein